MEKLTEKLESIKSSLTAILKDDNTDEISAIAKSIDEAKEISSTMEKETQSLKDKIVEMVSTSITSTKAPEDTNQDKTPKTLDEAFEEAFKNVESKRNK